MQKRSSAIAPVVILSLLLVGQVLTGAQAGPPSIPPPSSEETPRLGPVSVPTDTVCLCEWRCYWTPTGIICEWVCYYERAPYEGNLPFGP